MSTTQSDKVILQSLIFDLSAWLESLGVFFACWEVKTVRSVFRGSQKLVGAQGMRCTIIIFERPLLALMGLSKAKWSLFLGKIPAFYVCSLSSCASLSNDITSLRMIWLSMATWGTFDWNTIVHLREALERKKVVFLRPSGQQCLIRDRGLQINFSSKFA